VCVRSGLVLLQDPDFAFDWWLKHSINILSRHAHTDTHTHRHIDTHTHMHTHIYTQMCTHAHTQTQTALTGTTCDWGWLTG